MKFNATYGCTCGHAGHWHHPECRIPHCTCTTFRHATIDTAGLHHGHVHEARLETGRARRTPRNPW